MRVAVTGASGFVGTALVASLQQDGHDVVRFVRRAATAAGEASWDPLQGTIDRAAFDGTDAIVHLAGEGIGNKRWSESQKQRIRDSRVRGTTLLASTIADIGWRGTFVSGSAVGYYGLRGDEVLTEDSAAGGGFLAGVCKDWEAATAPAAEAGARVVCTRMGIVLGPRGGALGRMVPLFRIGLGGRMGSGRQWWSWVSLADAAGLLRHAITTPTIEGPMNLTSPNPVTNAELASTLGDVMHRPSIVPVPKAALSLVMGKEMTEEFVLAGQRVLPNVAEASGYAFRNPNVASALEVAVVR